ncbi:hypothetical protein NTE_01167 [Candidatus Nitrososphaera evergladensis SR1]|uniref:Uncharacterized protein n=1 Tax=Candidatus Nitrososphaera evergladensis SR1 TaxID=1459636 RepID=A0A075MQ93_9ARCH|nr:hypothetical protein [Candidatus Nitrososphaera evergladensis]AIF83240.1 hypothetical protein NTE_01167 [Candidatus Nitrososphaera evergladensis SR1]
MLPKTVQEFYPFAVHTIYAVIITLSFEVASHLLIPIENVFSSWDNILRSAGLMLAYIIIISGWIGYTKSISKRPHSENHLGNARFVMDLVILFLVFYLMSFANEEDVPGVITDKLPANVIMKINSIVTIQEFVYFFASFRYALATTYFALKDAQKIAPPPYIVGSYLYDIVAAWNLTHHREPLTLGYMMAATEQIANNAADVHADAACYR